MTDDQRGGQIAAWGDLLWFADIMPGNNIFRNPKNRELIILAMALLAAGAYLYQEYPEANLGWFARAIKYSVIMPNKIRWIMPWKPSGLNFLPICKSDEPVDRFLSEDDGPNSPDRTLTEAILLQWHSAGYTDLKFHKSGADHGRQEAQGYYQPDKWQSLDKLVDQVQIAGGFDSSFQFTRVSL